MPKINRPVTDASILNDLQRRVRMLEVGARTGLGKTRFVSDGDDGAPIAAVNDFVWSPLAVGTPLLVTVPCRRVVTVTKAEVGGIGNGVELCAAGLVTCAVDGAAVPGTHGAAFAYGMEDGTMFAPGPHPPPIVAMAQHTFDQDDAGPHTFELWVSSSKNSVTPPNTAPSWYRPSMLVIVLA